jgi:hypothetical protein
MPASTTLHEAVAQVMDNTGDPLLYLARVKTRIAILAAENDDYRRAYMLLHFVQQCVQSGQTTQCVICHQMEGLHDPKRHYCPKVERLFGEQPSLWYTMLSCFKPGYTQYTDAEMSRLFLLNEEQSAGCFD